MDNYYYNTLKILLNENLSNNLNILIYINNYFNIYEYFSHIIKKKNLNIYILINSDDIYIKLKNNIEGEDYENNIHILNNELEIISIKIDYVILFHLFSYFYLEEKLNYFKNINNNNLIIYIFCSLSNENETIINYKNKIRDNIKKYTNIHFGTLLYLTKVLEIIDTNNFKVKTIDTIKKNNYFLYGDNIVYSLKLEYI